MGRKSLGHEAAFTVSTVNGIGLVAWPSDPPTLDVWAGTTLIFHGLKMPKVDQSVTGLFRLNLFLDGQFAIGRYEVVMRWKVGTYYGVQLDRFEVIAGGHVDGTIISMFYHEMPHANFIVQQTDGGHLRRGKNPKV